MLKTSQPAHFDSIFEHDEGDIFYFINFYVVRIPYMVHHVVDAHGTAVQIR